MTFLCDTTAARAAFPTGDGRHRSRLAHPTGSPGNHLCPHEQRPEASPPVTNLLAAPCNPAHGLRNGKQTPLEDRTLTALTWGPTQHIQPRHSPFSLPPNPRVRRQDGTGSQQPVLRSAGKALVGLGLPLLAAAIVTLGKSGTRVQGPSQRRL